MSSAPFSVEQFKELRRVSEGLVFRVRYRISNRIVHRVYKRFIGFECRVFSRIVEGFSFVEVVQGANRRLGFRG